MVKKVSPRLAYFKQEGVWDPGTGIAWNRKHTDVFSFNLHFRTLPTERNIQVVNAHLERLYKDSKCALCGHGIGNEHHIFCRCGSLWDVRFRSFEKGIRKLERLAQKNGGGAQYRVDEGTKRQLEISLFPRDKGSYKNGAVPMRVKDWLSMIVGDETKVDKLYNKVQAVVSGMYKEMWNVRCDRMVKQEKTLKDRLKQEYRMTVGTLKRTYITLRKEHMDKMRRLRQGIAEQEGENVAQRVGDVDEADRLDTWDRNGGGDDIEGIL
jgi:hypothetical protein